MKEYLLDEYAFEAHPYEREYRFEGVLICTLGKNEKPFKDFEDLVEEASFEAVKALFDLRYTDIIGFIKEHHLNFDEERRDVSEVYELLSTKEKIQMWDVLDGEHTITYYDMMQRELTINKILESHV